MYHYRLAPCFRRSRNVSGRCQNSSPKFAKAICGTVCLIANKNVVRCNRLGTAYSTAQRVSLKSWTEALDFCQRSECIPQKFSLNRLSECETETNCNCHYKRHLNDGDPLCTCPHPNFSLVCAFLPCRSALYLKPYKIRMKSPDP